MNHMKNTGVHLSAITSFNHSNEKITYNGYKIRIKFASITWTVTVITINLSLDVYGAVSRFSLSYSIL